MPLAEYDINGNLVRDYIYIGGHLVAEFRPPGTYYYYTSDQINSTRIVTNNGNVVYSAAFDPYGGVQKTWTSTYTPTLKFSGKERDGESGLDYFGARYYDKAQYRFISADPITVKTGVNYNAQLWNLYSYCNNNPIAYLDSDGLYPVVITVVREYITRSRIQGRYYVDGAFWGYTLEHPWRNNATDISCIRFGTYDAELNWMTTRSGTTILALQLLDVEGHTGIFMHGGQDLGDTTGCILIGLDMTPTGNLLSGSLARTELVDYINNLATMALTSALDAIDYVMISFETLLSMADFPEVKVTVTMSRAVARWIFSMCMPVFAI